MALKKLNGHDAPLASAELAHIAALVLLPDPPTPRAAAPSHPDTGYPWIYRDVMQILLQARPAPCPPLLPARVLRRRGRRATAAPPAGHRRATGGPPAGHRRAAVEGRRRQPGGGGAWSGGGGGRGMAGVWSLTPCPFLLERAWPQLRLYLRLWRDFQAAAPPALAASLLSTLGCAGAGAFGWLGTSVWAVCSGRQHLIKLQMAFWESWFPHRLALRRDSF